jgi:hypothetical protein
MRQVACSITAKAYIRVPVSVTVSTKPAARIASACERRNVAQLVEVRSGAGSTPASCRISHAAARRSRHPSHREADRSRRCGQRMGTRQCSRRPAGRLATAGHRVTISPLGARLFTVQQSIVTHKHLTRPRDGERLTRTRASQRNRQLGADWEQKVAPNRAERRSTALSCAERLRVDAGRLRSRRSRACGPFVDTEEVTGSIPVSPTRVSAAQRLVIRSWVTSQLRYVPYIGSKLGAHDHLPGTIANGR